MGYTALFDMGAKTGWGVRNPGWYLFLNWLVPASWIATAMGTAYHEFGHFTRFKSVGFPDPYFQTTYNDKRYTNVFTYFIALFPAPAGGSTSAMSARFPGRSFRTTPVYSSNECKANVYISGAGVNNAMRFAGDLSDKAFENQSHLMDFIPYTEGKLQSLNYPMPFYDSPSNDMWSVSNAYKELGYGLDKSDIDAANLIAFFASASTYNYVNAWYTFVVRGDGRMHAMNWHGIRLPDVEAYLLMEGISYKVKTGYRISDTLHFPIAFEFVTKGSSGLEVSLGVQKRFESLSNLTLSGNVLLGRALGGHIKARWPFQKRFFVEGVVEHHNLKSYDGQRNIPTVLKSSDIDSLTSAQKVKATSVLLRVGFSY